ncbi:hypothetical protein [Leptolyngbya iicbica]|uniref:Uncharacterized protein n=2 Tax=Cyanophyceae TaxID=3028117 RepID=A0A4Q7EGK3_9CYAN|nr:hypothetical protein [Leptolyngbya sp. LK]RZM82475.1 hypothetical protein DYY88_04335 [Leptolyngbya sp. LK]
MAGSLMLCAAATANQIPSANVLDAAASQSTAIADGVYLYGSAPEPETLGAAYMVFAAQDAQLVGAMFMPQSSFDCFQGYRDGNELALQITNSYTQEVYGYAIALVTDDLQVASTGNSDFVLALDGFYDLGTPGESELAILSTCQAHYSSVGTEL